MRYRAPLIEGRLVRRYKRFFADVELAGGEIVVTHCANPGSMKTCAPDAARVWLSRSDDPRRRLAYTWELVEAEGAMVVVNTAHANAVVGEALAAGAIPELAGYRDLAREVPYGRGSRVDFLLTRPGRRGRCFVEVKGVTMAAGGRVSAFPDSVTERGTRHLQELIRTVRRGDRAVLLFCVGRDPTDVVRPADEIDPVYGKTLRRAARGGVEVLAYRAAVSPRGIQLRDRVPVEL